MSGYHLVRNSDDKVITKFPILTKPGSQMRILRFNEPSRARPSGELIIQNVAEMRLYRAAPAAVGVGFRLVPRP